MEAFEQLEENFKSYIGKNWNTVAVNSGTAALHVGIEALGLPLGSKVLVPDYCMYAVPRAVVMAGHVPVFADCYEQNLNIDIDWSVKRLGQLNCEDIKAVVAVHNYGRRAFMDGIHEVAKRYDWKVVEDLAEAHGVNPHPQTSVACWSFYKNKIIAGEEGGMVAFPNRELAAKARTLRCLGFTEHHDFWHWPRGVNARLSNACANLILPSLCDLECNLNKRKLIEQTYNKFIPDRFKSVARDVVWVYDLRLPGCNFEMLGKIVSELNEMGIQARQGFKANSFQSEFSRDDWKPNSYLASQEVMYLPVRSDMTEIEIYRNALAFTRIVTAQGL